MSKVITFSRSFPSYHDKAGQPTFFVEQILNQLGVNSNSQAYVDKIYKLNNNPDILLKFFMGLHHQTQISSSKKHTIRAGERFKAGEYFSPRVWSGKPYNSPQIIFWDDILIEKVIPFEISEDRGRTFVYGDKQITPVQRSIIAMNDGLKLDDFDKWFKYPKPFKGQVIVWDKEVDY